MTRIGQSSTVRAPDALAEPTEAAPVHPLHRAGSWAVRGAHPVAFTTMRYDRARQSLYRHTTYIVAAFVAGASRSA